MTKVRSFKKILLTLLFLAMLTCLFLAFAPLNRVNSYAMSIYLGSEPIQDQYKIGKVLNLSDVKIEHESNYYNCDSSRLTYPNGEVFSSESYNLTTAGKYKLDCFATINNAKVKSQKEFIVIANKYSVEKKNSFVEYGTTEKGNLTGVIVSLSAGDTFTYEKPINLTNLTKDNQLLRLYALPENLGVAEVKMLKITLTDVYDEQNKVEIVTYGNQEDETEKLGLALYSAAAATGQPLTGLHHYPSAGAKRIPYDGAFYNCVKNVTSKSTNGYPSYPHQPSGNNGFSFVGLDGYGKNPYRLSFDYAKKQLFGCEPANVGSNGMILDLDEPLFVDTPWQGFTTGEVYISVSADNYVGASFNFIITDIYGEDLSKSEFDDTTAPKIIVDTPKNFPYAVVGSPYRIFDYKIFEAVSDYVNENIYVYRNYNSSLPINVNLEDGSFTPTVEGEYSIVYKVTDAFGNTSTEVVNVFANGENLLKIIPEPRLEDRIVGQKVYLDTPIVEGSSGDYLLEVQIKGVNDIEYKCIVDNLDYYFIPMYAGDYTVTYTCTDYNSTVSTTKTVTVSSNPIPQFLDDAQLPSVMVKNVTYTLNDLYAYDFSDGTPVKLKADLLYKFDDATDYTLLNGKSLKITATSKAYFKYQLANNPTVYKEYEIPVTNVGYNTNAISIKDYFYGKNFAIDASDQSTTYSTEQDGELFFINSLLMSDFVLRFNVTKLSSGEISFSFCDVDNSANMVKLSFQPIDSLSCYMSVNDGDEKIISTKLVGKEIELKYSKEKGFTFAGIVVAVEEFAGFSLDKAYLTVSFKNISDTACFEVYQVNNQIINKNKSDYTNATYNIEINNGTKILGEEITLSKFIVADVLSFDVSGTITIYNPNGEICFSVDQVKLSNIKDFTRSYTFKAEIIGTYRISVKYSDGSNDGNFTKNVEVVDHVAPTIKLNSASKTGKINEYINVAKYTVSDTTDSKLTVNVSVISPTGKVTRVKSKFYASVMGTYIVTYTVSDLAGNVAFASYEVVVK